MLTPSDKIKIVTNTRTGRGGDDFYFILGLVERERAKRAEKYFPRWGAATTWTVLHDECLAALGRDLNG